MADLEELARALAEEESLKKIGSGSISLEDAAEEMAAEEARIDPLDAAANIRGIKDKALRERAVNVFNRAFDKDSPDQELQDSILSVVPGDSKTKGVEIRDRIVNLIRDFDLNAKVFEEGSPQGMEAVANKLGIGIRALESFFTTAPEEGFSRGLEAAGSQFGDSPEPRMTLPDFATQKALSEGQPPSIAEGTGAIQGVAGQLIVDPINLLGSPRIVGGALAGGKWAKLSAMKYGGKLTDLMGMTSKEERLNRIAGMNSRFTHRHDQSKSMRGFTLDKMRRLLNEGEAVEQAPIRPEIKEVIDMGVLMVKEDLADVKAATEALRASKRAALSHFRKKVASSADLGFTTNMVEDMVAKVSDDLKALKESQFAESAYLGRAASEFKTGIKAREEALNQFAKNFGSSKESIRSSLDKLPFGDQRKRLDALNAILQYGGDIRVPGDSATAIIDDFIESQKMLADDRLMEFRFSELDEEGQAISQVLEEQEALLMEAKKRNELLKGIDVSNSQSAIEGYIDGNIEHKSGIDNISELMLGPEGRGDFGQAISDMVLKEVFDPPTAKALANDMIRGGIAGGAAGGAAQLISGERSAGTISAGVGAVLGLGMGAMKAYGPQAVKAFVFGRIRAADPVTSIAGTAGSVGKLMNNVTKAWPLIPGTLRQVMDPLSELHTTGQFLVTDPTELRGLRLLVLDSSMLNTEKARILTDISDAMRLGTGVTFTSEGFKQDVLTKEKNPVDLKKVNELLKKNNIK